MRTVIFKSENNAKIYEIRSAKNQGIYKAEELISKIKTDEVEEVTSRLQYEVIATEVNKD